MPYVVVPLAAAAFSALLTPPVRLLARRLGAMDAPGARKVHAVSVPRLGGVSVGAAGALALAIPVSLEWLWPGAGFDLRVAAPIVAGGAFAFAVGLADDIRGVGPLVKLVFELAGALVVVGAGITIERVTVAGTTYELGVLAVPLTLGWIVALTNAFNLIDGLDGLAAGIAIIAAVTCAAIPAMRGDPTNALLLGVLAGALAGFLPFNFNPATVFLGDGGSLLIGFVLAVTAITGWQKGATALAAGVPLLIFAVPIADALAALLRRTFVGFGPVVGQPGLGLARRLAVGDQQHIHHRLLALGLSHRATVLVLYALALAFSALALLSARGA